MLPLPLRALVVAVVAGVAFTPPVLAVTRFRFDHCTVIWADTEQVPAVTVCPPITP